MRPFQDWGMVCAPSYAAPSCNWLHYSIFVLRKSWQMWQISRIYPCEWNNRPLYWVWALLHVRKFTFSNSEAWRMANIILFKAPVSAPLLEEYLSDNLLMPGTARHSAEKTHHVLCFRKAGASRIWNMILWGDVAGGDMGVTSGVIWGMQLWEKLRKKFFELGDGKLGDALDGKQLC